MESVELRMSGDVKASKCVDDTKIKKDNTELQQQALAKSVEHFKNCCFSSTWSQTGQTWSLQVPFTLSVILHFGVHLHPYLENSRCIDHVTLRDMISKLPRNGPRYGHPSHACVFVCLCLEWCVFCGVHDGEPVLTEGGAVCPSEVSHQLEKRKKKQEVNSRGQTDTFFEKYAAKNIVFISYYVEQILFVPAVIPGCSSSCCLCWASPPPSLRRILRLGRTSCSQGRVCMKTSTPEKWRRQKIK